MLEKLALCVVLPGLLWSQSSQGLVGRWRSVDVSKGGLGTTYEFRADGRVTSSLGATVEMPYRVEGDEIVLPSATKGGPEQRSRIAWRGDNNLRLIGSGIDEAYQRSGQRADPNKLIGEWVGSRDMGGSRVEVRFFFTGDGKSLLLIPFTTLPGRYATANGNLKVDWEQRGAETGTFKIDGAVLSLSMPGKPMVKLVRY
jgi:hypothetical protein